MHTFGPALTNVLREHLSGSPLREHLRFRNALRQNPELAAEYAALKRALADQYRRIEKVTPRRKPDLFIR
ncbi:MAG: GrpB family protein [Verrucomicrobia bacterium]|nr:GrpB family protein [Verrucomicrobiota bacterium]MBV8481361.1 GrpB family protein [Verrucomicrobiota bacterium]